MPTNQYHAPLVVGQHKLGIPAGHQITSVITSGIVGLSEHAAKDFIVLTEEPLGLPGVQCRTVYFKGTTCSLRIATVFVCMSQGLCSVTVHNPVNQPANLELVFTLSTEEKQ